MKGRTEARNVGARIVESRLRALGYTRGEMGMWVKGPSSVEISQWHVTHRRGRDTWNEVLSLIGNAHLRGDHARVDKLFNDTKIGEPMKERDLTLEAALLLHTLAKNVLYKDEVITVLHLDPGEMDDLDLLEDTGRITKKAGVDQLGRTTLHVTITPAGWKFLEPLKTTAGKLRTLMELFPPLRETLETLGVLHREYSGDMDGETHAVNIICENLRAGQHMLLGLAVSAEAAEGLERKRLQNRERISALETECEELRRALWPEQRKVRALRVAHAIIMNEDRHDPIDGWYARTLFTYDPNNPAMQPVIEYLASRGE